MPDTFVAEKEKAGVMELNTKNKDLSELLLILWEKEQPCCLAPLVYVFREPYRWLGSTYETWLGGYDRIRKEVCVMRYICFLLLLGVVTGMYAGDSITLKFRSRALLDASVMSVQGQTVKGYYRLEDFRMGLKALYKTMEIKADVGFGSGKVAVKDLIVQAGFGNSTVAVGNMYEPFSMDMLISTADLRFHQSATSVLAFTDGRKLGITWHYHVPSLYLASGIYTYNDINRIGEGQRNSFVSTSRLAWRGRIGRYGLLHIGGAFSYRSAPSDQAGYCKEISTTGVTSMFTEPVLDISLVNPGNEYKSALEVLIAGGCFLLQGEYFLNCYDAGEKGPYIPHGGYVQGSFLLQGEGFCYDTSFAVPGRPLSEKAVELTARFNYTNMNDYRAGMLGGTEKDLSIGINYYLNSYIGMKLSGSYVWGDGNCGTHEKKYFVPQARIQYIF